jgi:hypothetical protein
MDEVDAFLASDEDVDAFLADDVDPNLGPYGTIGPQISPAALQRAQNFSVSERALLALQKMQKGQRPEADEIDALDQAMRQNKMSTSERLREEEARSRPPVMKAQAMALGNALTAGMGQRAGEMLKPVGDAFGDAIGVGHDPKSIAQQSVEGKRAYPKMSSKYDLLGRVGAGAMAGNTYTGQAISGAAQGYNDAGPGVLDKIVGTGAGALAGVVGKGLGDYAPGELYRLAQKAKGGAGKGMESLARLLGFNGPKLSSQADDGAALAHEMTDFVPPDSPDVQLGRQMEDELRRMANSPRTAEEYTAGRTLPEAFDDIARDVNAVGKGNVRPGDWQPVPKEKADLEALERLARQGRVDDYYRRKAEMDAVNSEIADTVANKQHVIKSGNPVAADAPTNAKPGAVGGEATAVMSPDDVGQLKQRALMDNIAKAQEIQPYDSGLPIENWSAAPRKPKNAIDVIAQADNLGAPPSPPAAPATPIDPRRQKIIDAQMANPEALAAFGVDPRKGERGFDGFGALAGYYGIKKGVDTAKAAAPMVGQLGQSMQQSARQSLSPDAMARRAVSDPAIILQLVREGGVLGAAAQSMLAALQSGDQAGLKARAALLGTMPEFRQKFAQGTAGQGPAMSAASGY